MGQHCAPSLKDRWVFDKVIKRRGLKQREAEPIAYIGVDEKSFRKGHYYVTMVSDINRSRVVYVSEDRKQTSLDGF